MKRPTKRPFTPAELNRLWTGKPPAVEESEPVKGRKRGKVVGMREAEARRAREEWARRSSDAGSERR